MTRSASRPLISPLSSQLPSSPPSLGALTDDLHFNLPAQRTFGQRYCEEMLEFLNE